MSGAPETLDLFPDAWGGVFDASVFSDKFWIFACFLLDTFSQLLRLLTSRRMRVTFNVNSDAFISHGNVTATLRRKDTNLITDINPVATRADIFRTQTPAVFIVSDNPESILRKHPPKDHFPYY